MYSISIGYSHFFRVQFYLKQQSVTIWIVLDTLVPIGVGSNNELYAVVPNIPIKSVSYYKKQFS